MWRMAVLGAVFMLSATPAVAQDLYKCKMPDGRIVISNAPCPGAKDETVTPRTAPSPSPTPPPSAAPSAPPSVLPPPESVPRPFAHQATDETCTTLGKTAESLAILRDRGKPASEFLAMMHEAALKTGGVEGAYWEKVSRSMILAVYANTWWTPAVARQRIELACFQGKEPQ